MKKNNFMKKVYRNFEDFIKTSSAKELQYFVLDGKFTTDFNNKVKIVIDEITENGRVAGDFFALFNTTGEIAIINEEVVGSYIADKYKVILESYYKRVNLNSIINSVVNGNENVKKDFILISYACLYKTLNEIYKEIKYRKEIEKIYRGLLQLEEYKGEDIAIIILSTLITEDICRYLGISINYQWVVNA